MALVFPVTPSVNDTVTDPATNAVWIWDGIKWGRKLGTSTLPPFLAAAQRTTPLMLAATNGAVSLLGSPPVLTRIGNSVSLQYQGQNKTTITANTISLAEIPPGYEPTGNVAQAIQTPAITMNIQRYTGATTVFPDVPGSNQAGGGLRWSLRHGTQLAANAAVSINMSWQTADPFPP
jgi:hypothetical protein